MYQAVDEITNYIASNKEKFEQEIEQIQSVAKTTRGITQLPVTVLYKTNQFKVQCRQCSIFLCFSTDLRKVQNTHHVCIGESIWQNITRESENDTALKYDGKSLKFYGSIYCKNKDEVGHVCEFRGIRYPILLIKNIQFEDASGNADIYNKWSKIPFQVEDISR